MLGDICIINNMLYLCSIESSIPKKSKFITMKKFLLSLIGAAACLSATATDYELVTNAADLVPGCNYLLVATSANQAMGGAYSTNKYFTVVDITKSTDKSTITITDEKVVPVTLVASGDATYPYQLQIGEDLFLSSPNTSNEMKGAAATDTKTYAKISVAETGVATINLNNKKKDAEAVIKYNPTDGQNRFTCYFTAVADGWETGLYKEVTEVAAVAKPVFSIGTGSYVDPQEVTISCETEGAEIFYTTDGTEPSTSSNKYTAPLAITATTTLKAIAAKDGATSSVTTAVYTFVKSYTSMFDLLSEVTLPENYNDESESFVVDFEPVVAYANDPNIYITEGGMYTFVFIRNSGIATGDKLKAGWMGHVVNYNGLYEIVPETALEANGTGEIPAPAEVLNMTSLTNSFVNNIMMFPEIRFDEATPDARTNFKGMLGNEEVTFYNTFSLESYEAGVYNVKAIVSIFKGNMQMLPIEYTRCTTARPSLSTPAGEVAEGTEISIACITTGAKIFYTTDGTAPTAESTEYTAPIAINGLTTIKAIAIADGYLDSEIVSATYTVEGKPATYYVLPAGEMPTNSTVIPTVFYPWYQCAGAQESTEAMGDMTDAKVYTFTVAETLEAEAASGGWMSTGFDVSPILTGEYDLVFEIRSTSAAATAVKLVPEGQEDKGNETAFTFEHNGEWQTVRMNVAEAFPRFAASGATDGKVYVFSFVAGAGVKGGDTFTIADVRYEPVVVTPDPIVVPDNLYLMGHVDGNGFTPAQALEMDKDGNTFTITATVDDADQGYGYFAFTTVQSSDWEVVNQNRWAASQKNEEVTLDTPTALEHGVDRSFKIAVGKYIFKVVFNEYDVQMTVTAAPADGIADIEADNTEAVYYNLQGVRVDNPGTGIYLMQRGTEVTKVMVK